MDRTDWLAQAWSAARRVAFWGWLLVFIALPILFTEEAARAPLGLLWIAFGFPLLTTRPPFRGFTNNLYDIQGHSAWLKSGLTVLFTTALHHGIWQQITHLVTDPELGLQHFDPAAKTLLGMLVATGAPAPEFYEWVCQNEDLAAVVLTYLTSTPTLIALLVRTEWRESRPWESGDVATEPSRGWRHAGWRIRKAAATVLVYVLNPAVIWGLVLAFNTWNASLSDPNVVFAWTASVLTVALWTAFLLADTLYQEWSKSESGPRTELPAVTSVLFSLAVASAVGGVLRAEVVSRALVVDPLQVCVLLGLATPAVTLVWLFPPWPRRAFLIPPPEGAAAPDSENDMWAPFRRAYKARLAAGGVAGGPVFVVAANGGGIQAMLWSVLVLGRLGFHEGKLVYLRTLDKKHKERDDARQAFWKRIVFMTGTSGGAVAVASIVEHYIRFEQSDDSKQLNRALAEARDSAVRGYLDDVARAMLFFWVDRGELLQRIWTEKAVGRGGQSASFRGSLREKQKAGKIPTVVLSPTVLETGLPMTFASWPMHRHLAGLDGPDVPLDLFATKMDCSLQTAARLSATFPYVTAMPRLIGLLERKSPWESPKGRRELPRVLHFADSGYFDNNGMFEALRWVEAVVESEREVVIVSLDGFPWRPSPDLSKKWPFTRLLQSLRAVWLGPPTLMARTRTAGQRLRNETTVQTAKHQTIRYVEFRMMDVGADRPVVPLTWSLSESELLNIYGSLETTIVAALKEFERKRNQDPTAPPTPTPSPPTTPPAPHTEGG